MTNIFQWIGLALGLLVASLGIRAILRGLSPKPNAPMPRRKGKRARR